MHNHHREIVLLGSSSPLPPPSSNFELPDLQDILGIKRFSGSTRNNEIRSVARTKSAPLRVINPSSDIDVFSSSPPQPRAPPTLVARSRTAATRPPPRLAGMKSSLAPLPHDVRKRSDLPPPVHVSYGDLRWEMTDDETDSELIRQAGLNMGTVGGSGAMSRVEESVPVAGPSRLSGEVVEPRGGTAKRNRTSVRRDSKLSGGMSDEEILDSSEPKAKKAKATVSGDCV